MRCLCEEVVPLFVDDGYTLLLHTHKKSDRKKENVAIGVGFCTV